MLENGEFRQRSVERHVQRHYAAELRERVVDVAHSDSCEAWKSEIESSHGATDTQVTHAACNRRTRWHHAAKDNCTACTGAKNRSEYFNSSHCHYCGTVTVGLPNNKK